MGIYFDSLGLATKMKTKRSRENLLDHAQYEGKPITGYYGYPYRNLNYGTTRIIAYTIPDDLYWWREEKFDTHCDGPCIWKVRVEEPPKFYFDPICELSVRSMDGNTLLIINVVNADVLPSFKTDEIIELQMAAFAFNVHIFDNENEYFNSTDLGINGQKPLMKMDSIFPQGLFSENDNINDVVRVHGRIKRTEYGNCDIFGEEKYYNRFYVDTQIGELMLVVPDRFSKKHKKDQYNGKIIDCCAHLSGNAAINSYKNGIVMDEENNFKLLVYTFSGKEGNTDRLRPILSKQFVYCSECSGKRFEEIDEFIRFTESLQLASWWKKSHFQYGVITDNAGRTKAPIYSAGTRCALIRHTDEENPYGILFMETGKDGKISNVYVTKPEGYSYREDDAMPRPEAKEIYADLSGETYTDRAVISKWEFDELIKQRIKFIALRDLRRGYTESRFDDFWKHMAQECVFESQWLEKPIIGASAIMDFLIGEGMTLKKNLSYPRALYAESEMGDSLLFMRQAGEMDGVLVSIQLDDENMVSRINLFSEKDVKYRVFNTMMWITPVKELYDGENSDLIENDAGEMMITDLYYDELRVFFDIGYCGFSEYEDHHMFHEDWDEIVQAWRAFYETDDFESMLDEMYQKQIKSDASDPKGYAEWFKSAARTVWEKKNPYGWEMLIKLESWLNHYKDHDWIYMV